MNEKIFQQILEKLDSIETRVTNIETRTSSIETTTSNIETRVTNIETKTSNIETRVTNIETRTSSIETKTSNIETRVANIETRTSSIETKTDNIETRTSNIETKTDNIETRTSNIENRTSNIENTINNIEGTQQEHTQLLRALEYRTDVTNATVTTIDETLQRTEGKIASMKGEMASMEGRMALLEKTTLSIGKNAEHNRKETIVKLETLDSSVMYLANKLTQHDKRTQGDGSFVSLVTNIEENEKTRNTKEWFSCVLKKLQNDTKVTVGIPVTRHPPYRSQRAELPHWAPNLGQTRRR